jgi:N-acylneuraminate cytidylyltransferase/CMP-N,N'-diacetyllegionaminic acid synthase
MPLICHSIKVALSANTISRVVVSTDDQEIAAVARECGAEVPFIRPPELAADDSMAMDAYLYTVDRIAEDTGAVVDAFVALLPTVPLRVPSDIDEAIGIFTQHQADSVISVTESQVPIEWHRKINSDGVLSSFLPEFDAITNRQQYPRSYLPNGSIYVFRTEILRKTRQYYTEKTYPYVMPRERSADIDDLLDFEWVEFLLAKQSHANDW